MHTKDVHKDHTSKGIIAALGAFFFLAVMTAGVKILAENHHVIEIAFYRNLIAALPMLGFILFKNRYDLFRVKQKKMLTARVLFGYFGLLLTLASVHYLPLSDATVIFMGSTIIIPVLAFIFLKERTGIHRWAAIIVGFFGVFLAAAPTGQVQLFGVTLALLTACFHAGVQVFLRRLREESSFTVTLYFLLGGVGISAFLLPFVWNLPTLTEWPLFIAIGLLAGAAQYCLATAFKFAPASVVAPFNYTGLLWASALDIMIWSYIPGWPVFVGGAIIILSKLYIIHRERVSKLTKSQIP